MIREDVTVAIIDDEDIIRRTLSSWLEDFEYNVLTIESGTLAVKNDAISHADVAIVDMRMEGLNGNQTVEELHKINSNMKFILHTGSNDYIIPESLKEIGLTSEEILHKPVLEMNNFCIIIDNLMGIKEK